MADEITEQLVLAIEAVGAPEAAAQVEGVGGAVKGLTAAVDDSSVALTGAKGEAAARGRGGLLGGLMSLKSLAVAGTIVDATKKFVDFQSQMLRVNTQAGASMAEVSRMQSTILHMAPRLATGPQELAEALYHIESAGIRGQKAVEALTAAAKLAKVSGADLSSTTISMNAVISAGYRDATKAAAAFNAAVGAGDMTMENLNEALGTGFLSVMRGAGLQVKDVTAALAVFGDNNVKGAHAATLLRQAIDDVTSTSEKSRNALAGIGLGPEQLAKDLQKHNGLLAMVRELHSHLQGLSNVQQNRVVQEIFGRQSAQGVELLLRELPKLEEKYGAVTKGQHDFNAAWERTRRTLSFFFDQVKALAEVGLVKLGEGIAWVVGKVRDLVSAFQEGKLWAQVIVGVAAGLAYLLTTWLAFEGAMKAASLISKASGEFGLWEIAIIAVVMLLVLLVTHWKQVKRVAVDAWDWIKNAAIDAWSWIKSHWEHLPTVIQVLINPLLAIVTHFGAIKKAAVAVWDWIKGAWHELEKILTTPFEVAWKVIHGVFMGIVHAVAWVAHEVGKLLKPIEHPLSTLGHIGGGIVHTFEAVIPHFAAGGPVRSNGPALVGERGPEIVWLPRGSYVQPNHELGGGAMELYADQPIVVALDGEVLARSNVRVGLKAQSRMGI